MTCELAEPLLARAADGTLDAEGSRRLARHLEGCADCREALAAQRAVRSVLAGRPAADVRPGFAARVMAHLPDPERGAAAGWLDALNWRAWTLRLAPVAGALFVAAALGPGPSIEGAEPAPAEVSDLVTAWVSEESEEEAEGPGQDAPAAEADTTEAAPGERAAPRWPDADETAEDLLIDVLLAGEPSGALFEADEAGR